MGTLFATISMAASKDYTEVAIRSLLRTTNITPEDTLVVLDNDGSLDAGDEARLRALTAGKSFHLVRVNRDHIGGFSENANELIRLALQLGSDLLLFNNDLVFTPGWYEPVEALGVAISSPLSNREVQYATSVYVTSSGEVASTFVCHQSLSLEDFAGKEAQLHAIAETHRSRSRGVFQVYVLPFFCVRIPREVLLSIGAFDESFGAGGGEDYDYGLRALLSGFPVRYALSSYILHFGGRSSWATPEAEEKRQAREAQFRGRFRDKWGDDLYRLILEEHDQVIQANPELKALDTAGELPSVVRRLMAGRHVELHMPLSS